jgi:hypothetical protein
MNPDGGDYAASKYLNWHRGLSITVVGVLFVFYVERFGIGLSIRRFAGFVIPLLLIWFSDELSGWGSKQSGNWFSNVTGDTYVRICAWLLLLVLVAMRIMALVSV